MRAPPPAPSALAVLCRWGRLSVAAWHSRRRLIQKQLPLRLHQCKHLPTSYPRNLRVTPRPQAPGSPIYLRAPSATQQDPSSAPPCPLLSATSSMILGLCDNPHDLSDLETPTATMPGRLPVCRSLIQGWISISGPRDLRPPTFMPPASVTAPFLGAPWPSSPSSIWLPPPTPPPTSVPTPSDPHSLGAPHCLHLNTPCLTASVSLPSLSPPVSIPVAEAFIPLPPPTPSVCWDLRVPSRLVSPRCVPQLPKHQALYPLLILHPLVSRSLYAPPSASVPYPFPSPCAPQPSSLSSVAPPSAHSQPLLRAPQSSSCLPP